MSAYVLLLTTHIVGACIWVGGHLTLACTILPRALRERNAQRVLDFERGYERIGLPALAAQVLSGAWLAYLRLGGWENAFAAMPIGRVFQLKLLLLGGTVALAVHARLRLIPRLTDATLPRLAAHIAVVTLLAVGFVVAGVAFRLGGIF